MGLGAFEACTSLINIFIPEGVTKVGYGVFKGWTRSQTINCEAKSRPDAWDEDWVYYGYGWFDVLKDVKVNWGQTRE